MSWVRDESLRCSVEACDKVVFQKIRGLCSMHNARFLRHGSVDTVLRTGADGPANGSWKGDEVGYVAMHARVRRRRGGPISCTFALDHHGPFEWALDHRRAFEARYVDNHGVATPISTDIEDYVSLCVQCHRSFDSHPFMKGGEACLARMEVSRLPVGASRTAK